MRRRDFIVGFGGAAAWPLVVGAQQPERMRRIGVLWDGRKATPKRGAGFTRSCRDFRSWVGRWPQREDGRSFRRPRRQDADVRQGVGGPTSRRDSRRRDSGYRCTPAGDTNDPHRLCGRLRPGLEVPTTLLAIADEVIE
jgi:hypothetical protein